MSIPRRFLELFRGSELGHGTYRPPSKEESRIGKVEIKTSARTIREYVTETLWHDHLQGITPLGIIPIREDDTCLWGCIDIDKYDLVLSNLAEKVASLGVPLFLGKSKSGGAHIFVFLDRPVSALSLQRWLRDVAARLGYAQSEIFPKQTTVLRNKGDLGNWMIMPYFGDTMPVLRSGGGEYTPEEFLRAAEKNKLDSGMLNLPVAVETGVIDITDGPPCLQHLVSVGFGEGTRNNGLFALGVYAKKKWPEEWEDKLEELNRTVMTPPLTSDEVMVVKKSLRRKDYQYKCKDIPLVSHCNSNLCRLRPFGVGESLQFPQISGLSVLDTDPPLWFADIGEDRIELTTEQLVDYVRFHRVCVERLFRVYPMVRREEWNSELSRAMAAVIKIEVSPDVAVSGAFREEVEDFLTNRQRGKRKEDLLSGRPWEDSEDGCHYFRLRDLRDRLDRNKVLRNMTQAHILQRIKDLGGGHRFMKISGRGVNLHYLPTSLFYDFPEIDPPDTQKEVF